MDAKREPSESERRAKLMAEIVIDAMGPLCFYHKSLFGEEPNFAPDSVLYRFLNARFDLKTREAAELTPAQAAYILGYVYRLRHVATEEERQEILNEIEDRRAAFQIDPEEPYAKAMSRFPKPSAKPEPLEARVDDKAGHLTYLGYSRKYPVKLDELVRAGAISLEEIPGTGKRALWRMVVLKPQIAFKQGGPTEE